MQGTRVDSGDESGMDESLPSSSGSVSTNATSTTAELEERFQRALTLEAETQHRILEDTEVDHITQDDLDALYAKDMFELTGKERDEALHDIHGVSDTVEETPDFVAHNRKQLEQELALLVSRPRHKSMAYQLALKQHPKYIESAEFQLMFLRADRWDAREAAERMLGFLEIKLALFGQELLGRSVRISDLSKEDNKSLDSGFFQLLSVRDAGGRAIMVGMPMLRQYKHVDNLKRTFFYMIMTALEDESTQKAGVVMVGCNMGPKRIVDRKAAFAINSIRRFLPVHMPSVHYCYDDIRFRPMMTIAMLVMGATNRVRFRAHYGPPNDIGYRLSTFGIPWDALPVTKDGEPKTKSHKSWVKFRKSQEQSQVAGIMTQLIVVVPSRLDVLLGRGKPIQEHIGNIRYHALLDYYQDAYERAQKFHKMKISQRILDTVAEYGGRFLRQEGAGWVQVEDQVARDKVAHAFRTRRTAAIGGSTTMSTGATAPQISSATSVLTVKRSKLEMMDPILEQVASPAAATLSCTTSNPPSPASFQQDFCDAGTEGGKDESSSEETGGRSGKRMKVWT